jgi:hypothetical protein
MEKIMPSAPVTFKAQALARDLAVNLKLAIPGSAVASTSDANGFPVIQVSVGAKKSWLSIKTDSAVSDESGKVDALGLPQKVYTPHVCELVMEASATADATTLDMRAEMIAQTVKLGTKVSIKEGTNVEDAADYTAALAISLTETAKIKSDLINPLTSQI